MEQPVPPTRDELREHLVTTRIAGSVQTPVGDVLRKAQFVADGEEEASFGLTGLTKYSHADVLEQIRLQFGWTPTPGEHPYGPTYIDPDILLDELELARDRITLAGREGQRVIMATGHPTGVFSLHARVADALRLAGAKLLNPADGERVRVRDNDRLVRYVMDVATLSSGANLYHTHSAYPMRLVLDTVGDQVDLVIGDHGWAGTAAERGIDVIGIADINDPALPMARFEGRAAVVLGMDDNVVLPRHYDPVADFLTAGLR
jgi:hypothetical protein